MILIIFLLILSATTMLFGFISLLGQKIYYDQKTEARIEVKIPFFGKIKTNYPALVFVFASLVLVFFVYKLADDKIPWEIKGVIVKENNSYFDQHGLEVFPCDIETSVNPQTGEFKITAFIERYKSFEDVIKSFNYSDKDGRTDDIYPKEQLDNYKLSKESSLLKVADNPIRKYGTIEIKDLSQKEEVIYE